jgi:cytochrome P450 family 135
MGQQGRSFTAAAPLFTPKPKPLLYALPPGPRDRVRTTARWVRRPAELLDDCAGRYGNAFTLDLVKFGPAHFFASPQAAEALFRADPSTFRAGKTKFVRPILGPNALLCLDGPEHLHQRRLLLPALHGQRITRYAELTAEIADAELGRWPLNTPFSLAAAMRRIAFAVMLRNVFGLGSGGEHTGLGAAVFSLMHHASASRIELVRMAARRDLTAAPTAQSKLGRLLAGADAAVFAIIAERRRAGAVGDDVLSMLLAAHDERGGGMSDHELRDELMTLLLAGWETTAASLSWAFERLLRHPAAWTRLQAEASEDGTGPWVSAVVSETLRTRPVLWLAGRTLLTDQEIDGHTLPAGSLAYLCSYLLHRREDIYPEPLTFRPERWLGRQRGAYTFVPFGGGIRRCIGAAFAEMEMRAVLSAVAERCRLEAVAPQRDETFRRSGIVVVPDQGARAIVTERR